MWNWSKRREWMGRNAARPDVPAVEQDLGRTFGRGKVLGKYALLHDYLANRYADVVVLTFGQIEDLLGSALPASARIHAEWWTETRAEKPPFSDAWVLAGRSAKANLSAQTVVFERGVSQ